jgi:hypothetical protein
MFLAAISTKEESQKRLMQKAAITDALSCDIKREQRVRERLSSFTAQR